MRYRNPRFIPFLSIYRAVCGLSDPKRSDISSAAPRDPPAAKRGKRRTERDGGSRPDADKDAGSRRVGRNMPQLGVIDVFCRSDRNSGGRRSVFI